MACLRGRLNSHFLPASRSLATNGIRWRGFLLPVVVGVLPKPRRRVVNILLCNLALTLFHQIDDSLVSLKILFPDSRVLPRGKNPDPSEREHRHKDLLRMLKKAGIAWQTAELEMEFKVAVDHFVGTICCECVAHHFKPLLERFHITGSLCGEARSQTLKNATHFKNLQNVVLAETDDTSTPSSRFGYKSILGEHVDCLADRPLGNTKLARPRSLDNSYSRAQRSAGYFTSETIRNGVLNERFGGTVGRSHWRRRFHSIASQTI